MKLNHEIIEKNTGLMLILIVISISFATLIEIVPLIFTKDVSQPLPNMKPWTALELEGRDIYIREGCHVCHTQMIRPLRAEVERYGPYSRAAESAWDHPFLWGSKRTGPDLARVGKRYSDDWQREHLINPQSLVPESVMPPFPWLAKCNCSVTVLVCLTAMLTLKAHLMRYKVKLSLMRSLLIYSNWVQQWKDNANASYIT